MVTERDITLLTDWDGSTDLSGWFVSEKLDGCRGVWDGARMWTRSEREIHLPIRLRRNLPTIPLDGEIWAGRGGFEVARQAVQYDHWTDACRFVAFDAPAAPGGWAERMGTAASVYGDVVPWSVFNGDPWTAATDVQLQGGEGLVFRRPGRSYVPGRDAGSVRVK